MAMTTADELIASVEQTLDRWRSALDSSLSHGKEETVTVEAATAADERDDNKKKIFVWEDNESYVKRLATFKPDTYFAKPLAISPLVSAAFGWENIGRDIIKCSHNQCKATLCIKFHHALGKESHANLCAKYLAMLASAHKDVCPFQSFAKRWLKAMERQSKTNSTVISDLGQNIQNEPAALMDRLEMALKTSTVDLYVPPYMLPLCHEMTRFEDFTGDGSVTKQSVEEDAIEIQRRIDAKCTIGVEMPNAVSSYCREILSDANVELFDKSQKSSRDAYMLSAFGWSVCDDNCSIGNTMGVVLKCKVCLARSILPFTDTAVNADSPKKKRRRVDTLRGANIKLIESHRSYCPYVSGFARGVSQQTEPSWKVVLSNLRK